MVPLLEKDEEGVFEAAGSLRSCRSVIPGASRRGSCGL